MGLAIIIKNVNFSSYNIGKVTPRSSKNVSNIEILGETIIPSTSSEVQFSIQYTPVDTYQTGVIWEIIDGNDYASISNEGVLTILSHSDDVSVTIQATSIYNSAIYAQKTIEIKHEESNVYMYSNLTNGDLNLYDAYGKVVMSPSQANYLASDETGTSFNRTKGFGIIYRDGNLTNVKSFSFEYYADTTKTGSLSNSWGALMNIHTEVPQTYRSSEPLVINKYPDNGVRFEAATNSSSGTPSQCTCDSTINASLGVWHKVCAVFNFDFSKKGTQDSFIARYYADGEYIGQATGYYNMMEGNSLCYVFGNSWRLFYNGTSSSDVNPFCGKIKNIKMYDYELSDEQAVNESKL